MFRFAMCNEAFGSDSFAACCRTLREGGYGGVEVAPFTLGASPSEIDRTKRRECRTILDGESLDFVGLHWLMVSPPGLHVTTPDAALRERSWQHVHELVDLCADLASPRSHPVMVFGSPKQRATTGGATVEEASARLADGLAHLAPYAESRGVTVLLEALPSSQCDVIRTLGEAVAVVSEIDSPAIQTMFDTHNAEDEVEPHPALIERDFPFIRHIHVNERDGRYPGTGDYNFVEILSVLRRLAYDGWISLEVFDFEPDPAVIARESIRYLKSLA